MRLTDNERTVIRETVRSMDPSARVYLFGSRTDDGARGGVIDLLVLSDTLRRDARIDMRVELKKRLGEQRFDIIVAKDTAKPFVKIAIETGVEL